jgi:hypothetical protein
MSQFGRFAVQARCFKQRFHIHLLPIAHQSSEQAGPQGGPVKGGKDSAPYAQLRTTLHN